MNQKPSKTFRLSKTTKRMMALMKGTDANRAQYKNMMIQAELAAGVVVKRDPKPAVGRGAPQPNK
jgi:hypothetical protein